MFLQRQAMPCSCDASYAYRIHRCQLVTLPSGICAKPDRRTTADGQAVPGMQKTIRTVRIRDRVVDDELPEAAAAYRSWLAEQTG